MERHAARRAELKQRCEAQRVTLAGQVADIEQRLQSTDHLLGSIRTVLTKPALLTGGAALLLTLGRSSWWSKISRSLVVLAAARRFYNAFKSSKSSAG